VGLFKHGDMDKKEYVLKLWDIHYLDIKSRHDISTKGNYLELGPGDSLNSGVLAVKEGFDSFYFIDVGKFADDSEKITNYINKIKNKSNIYKSNNLQNYFHYFTCGLDSLKRLSSNSVSYAFSNSVLQHIDKNIIRNVLLEINRVTKNCAIQSHIIDLRDMIYRSKYHYNVPNCIWESKYFKNKSIYTNRLTYKNWKCLFQEANYVILELIAYDCENSAINEDEICIDDNKVSYMHIIVRKNNV
jgi:hypothetical protein